MNQNIKGKFIVIDGIDGSGKTTQFNILKERLIENNYEVEIIDFPQYNKKSAGLVEEYLSGKYGEATDVGPFIASIFYASDRYDASFKIKKWLEEGKVVLSNRYVSSNMGHQGTKIKNQEERKKFFNWLYNLEYNIFKIPRPDLTAILYVPAEISQKLTKKRQRQDWKNKTKDIHEDNLDHLKQASIVYKEMTEIYDDMTLIDCTRNNELMSIEYISEILWDKIFVNFQKKEPQLISKILNKSIFASTLQSLKFEEKNSKSEEKLKLYFEKINPQAKKPSKAYEYDAGFDLYSSDYYSISPNAKVLIKTGIKFKIPDGFVGLIWDKSGIASQGIKTSGGVIDSDYRGEIKVNLINLSSDIYHIAPGQKIAQILIQKIESPDLIEASVDDETQRGEKSFGSSGKF